MDSPLKSGLVSRGIGDGNEGLAKSIGAALRGSPHEMQEIDSHS